ncbi:MAG: hypothetical protein IPK35_08115 [Saprospiraceae bacterium]|jgi:hypothetical protein|nr:hypothetical protein [Saprospiraceae bacterium]
MDKNLENNIKHHFENRRINPDPEAWSKLDGLLAQSEKIKPRFYRLFLKSSAAVALIIFGMFLSILLLMPEENAKTITINTEKELKTANSIPAETTQVPFQAIANKDTKTKSQSNWGSATSSNKIKVNTLPTEIDQPISISNIVEKPENKIASDHKVIQDTKNHLHQVKSADFVMVDPEKLLTDTESALISKSQQGTQNKYDIDPNKLLRQAEKEANRSYLLSAIKSMKEISSPMISAVISRNEIKAE